MLQLCNCTKKGLSNEIIWEFCPREKRGTMMNIINWIISIPGALLLSLKLSHYENKHDIDLRTDYWVKKAKNIEYFANWSNSEMLLLFYSSGIVAACFSVKFQKLNFSYNN